MGSSAYLRLKALERLNFYDEFNRAEEDLDVWTQGADGGGSFLRQGGVGYSTQWAVITGNVIDNDSYIHGGGVIHNKYFAIDEVGISSITQEMRLQLASIADISAFFGLESAVFTDYAEPVDRCAHFLADPAVTNTFRARNYQAAETETDTLIALDTNMHKFKIIWAAASVEFYIDDVLVATHTTNVPDLPMTSELLIRTEAAAVKTLRADYLRVTVE